MAIHPDQPRANSGGGVLSSYRPEGWQSFLVEVSKGVPDKVAYARAGVDENEVKRLAKPYRDHPIRIPAMAEELSKAKRAGLEARRAARAKAQREKFQRPDWFDAVLRRIETGVSATAALAEVGKKLVDVYVYTSPPKAGDPPRNPQMREDWERAQRDGRLYSVHVRVDEIKALMARGYARSAAVAQAGVDAGHFEEFLAACPQVREELDDLAAKMPPPRPYRTGVLYLTDRLKREIELGEEYEADEGELFDLRIFLRLVELLDVSPTEMTVPTLRDQALKLIGQRYGDYDDLPEFLKEGA